MIDSTSEKFPYPSFLFRLELKEGKEKRVCWFECKEHADKYIKRHKLNKKDYTLIIKSE